MLFYDRDASGRSWHKNPVLSFFSYLRDTCVFFLPLRRLPYFLVKFLYGVSPQYIFFVHARRTEDIYVALPFLVPVRKILGRDKFIKMLYYLPPFVLDTLKNRNGPQGLVVTSIFLSEILLKDSKAALRESTKGLSFAAKISPKGVVFGLGGLWPMVTKRGLALQRYAAINNAIITNGHCGTLASLFMAIKKIADLGGIPLNDLKVVILGVGKMGTNLARALYGKVAALTLVDINEKRLDSVEEKLKNTISGTDIYKYSNRDDIGGIKEVLSANHIGVCTTSNIRRVVKPEQFPENTIVIDDSRPEGMPRKLEGDTRIVLEGGLMKIKGIKYRYNFGFGVDENVFGCLAESYLLASDKLRTLRPTLGEVDIANFQNMVSSCSKFGVRLGDFKCRQNRINNSRIISIMKNKPNLASTIPFRNVCWIIKVEDLQNILK